MSLTVINLMPEIDDTAVVGKKFTWTDERVAELKKLWGPLSASEIGRLFGVTRNTIIGKTYRLGLAVQRRPPLTMEEKNRRSVAMRRTRCGTVDPVMEIDDTPDNEIPAAQRRTLFELTDETCRWPVGFPDKEDFFFCGAEPTKRSSYCECHTRRSMK